jgi:hypothetical protein
VRAAGESFLQGRGSKAVLRLLLALGLLFGAGAISEPAAAAPEADFSDWHLPVPAGEWTISRGPCGAGGLFQHPCGYYEDRCALDLTAVNGEMEDVPVLAPQAGQVFFLGTRNDSGLTAMLEHDDGRITALMHLAKVVVALDQRVAQGQVVAYAGSTGSSTRPHLHFHVQPNAVERECLPLTGLDEIDLTRLTARSHNLDWTDLTLVDPPEQMPAWLPLTAPEAGNEPVVMPQRMLLAPGVTVQLPVAYEIEHAPPEGLSYLGQPVPVAWRMSTHVVFSVPFTGPNRTGEFTRVLRQTVNGTTRTIRFRFGVRPAAESGSGAGLILINPTFGSPLNWSDQPAAPELCWREPASAGTAPLLFRVLVVGPTRADSGWIPEQCWQTPALAEGDYAWKVFVRDGQGYMNRTNQRPWVFRLR